MANISYNTLNIYSPNIPDPFVVPYYDNSTNSLNNTNMAYDSANLQIAIGSIASFDDNAGTVYLGYATASTSYLQLLTGNVLAIGAGTIRLDNMTLATTAGGSSGKHLPIVIGGTLYKIALLLP